MKIIQLNAWYFTLEDQLVARLDQQQADIVLLQEVVAGKLTRGSHEEPLRYISEQLGYDAAQARAYSVDIPGDTDSSFGVAVLSRYPIQQERVHYVPYLGPYRTYSEDEYGLAVRHGEETMSARLRTWTFQRQSPSPIADVVVSLGDMQVRIMTTHFKPTPKCTESYQMLKHAQYIQKLLTKNDDMPTILGGDFNIQPNSVVLQPLYAELDEVVTVRSTTLNPRLHPGFHNDIPPTGYQVDHLFQRGCDVVSGSVVDTVDVSDHFPLVAELTLK